MPADPSANQEPEEESFPFSLGQGEADGPFLAAVLKSVNTVELLTYVVGNPLVEVCFGQR